MPPKIPRHRMLVKSLLYILASVACVETRTKILQTV
jgi:hypothetical protein